MAMTSTGPDVLLRHLQHPTVDQAMAQAADRELLRCFAQRHDEAAFTALVRRHGAMVYHVCLRTLGHTQDAEDACQVTFLTLAARAGSGRWRESLAARRIALKARTTAAFGLARNYRTAANARAALGDARSADTRSASAASHFAAGPANSPVTSHR
jgi:hypothetical protein